MQFEMSTDDNGVRTCFPVGYDKQNLIDVTRVTDVWAQFVDKHTGETVDCEVFAKQLDAMRSARSAT
jgi:hypothetical protein